MFANKKTDNFFPLISHLHKFS